MQGAVKDAAQANLELYRAVTTQINEIERSLFGQLEVRPEFHVLKSILGVGDVLASTIMLETGDIGRFPSVGHYASYCRCVKSTRMSNNKKKGSGNAKSGNRYLSWAFSEAAHFAVRFDDRARRFYQRKKAKTNGIVAIRAVAHKLARASYCMLRDQREYDAKLAFG